MAIDQRTRIRIAHWYYEMGLTQEEIGKRLQIPRQRVNQIVKNLVADGVVSIRINGLDQEFIRLESAIEERFGIRQALVADYDQTEAPLLHVLGSKAAEYLDDFIRDGNTIGISWGQTMGSTVNALRDTHKTDCSVIQLVGGMNISGNHTMVKPDEITRILAGKLHCGYQNLYAPAMFDSKLAKDLIMREDSILRVCEAMKRCDIAVMGIGEIHEDATVVQNGYINANQLEMLRAAGYVGDICFNRFDINGNWENGELSSLTLGIDPETLQNIPHVITVAGGVQKRDAILGALRTGCIDVLVIDSVTARSLLDER